MAKKRAVPARRLRSSGHLAEAADKRLHSYTVGALPILNHFLKRLDLETLLARHLPAEDARTIVPTTTGLLLLVRNVLVSREPIYGVADWAYGHAPDLLNLSESRLAALNDDRLGRCLNRLFRATGPELILDVVRQAIREFGLRLDELHNDSTSISFYGQYLQAAEEKTRQGRKTQAITFGHSKDHRPDLKQLLYVLTVSDDGGVPVYFTTESGNTSDDPTHIGTWDLLCQLVGSPDFLYVADCKLASTANLDHITRRGGRFVTVLPGSRREDAEFRGRLGQSGPADWQHVYDVTHPGIDPRGKPITVVTDRLRVWAEEQTTDEGYRLLWYHSSRKAEQDRLARAARTERALLDLVALRERLEGPKTRFREREKVEQAVAEILGQRDVERWVRVRVEEQETKRYRPTTRGRPSSSTRYVCDVETRFRMAAEVDQEQLERETLGDGVFPLITNQRQMTAEELLQAYKRQPLIEKRFSQFKNDFCVAPVYLQDVSRIQGLLCVYFLALLVQTLLERELRQAMEHDGVEHLPLYGEDRDCRRPTTRKVIDAFEPVQRHVLRLPDGREEVLNTQLTPQQTQILELLGLSPNNYGQ